MGLIHNLLISIVHLIFVGMDILVTMILIRVVYERWRPKCLRLINNAVEPVMKSITGHLGTWVSRTTGRTYTDKTMLMLFIVCLSFVRLVICGLV
jgi:hypothetical protein